MSAATTVAGAGSPQRESAPTDRPPINGEGENAALSDNSPSSTETTKAIPGPAVNQGVSSASGEPAHHPDVPTNARPSGGGSTGVPNTGYTGGGPSGPQATSPAARPQPAQPMMNRGGVVSMSRMSSGAGPSQNPSQGGWTHSSPYNSRPPQSMNRYNSDPPPATGYANYQNRPYDQQGGGEPLSKTNLYIRGLMPGTTDHDLLTLCQQYGKIKSTKAIVDQATNKCKGYGFVDFEKPSDAERATVMLQQTGIQAQMAKVRESSLQDQDPTNLYMANLPDYVDENYLEGMVRPYGNVVSVRILRDNAGKSRNVGFCRMDNKDICERIIHELNKKALPGAQEPLLVKFADSGSRRKREYRNQHALVGYDAGMPSGPMGGQMMAQGMNARYPMQPVTNQSSYLPNAAAAGSWQGMPMYPQVAMSPVNPVTSIQNNIMDPTTTLLASQLGQMQIAPTANYGMQQSQQTYPQMYQGQGMVPQFQYEMSASPPNHLGHTGLEDPNYQNFGQM